MATLTFHKLHEVRAERFVASAPQQLAGDVEMDGCHVGGVRKGKRGKMIPASGQEVWPAAPVEITDHRPFGHAVASGRDEVRGILQGRGRDTRRVG